MKDFFLSIADLESRGESFVLATVTHTGGSTPRMAGAQMAVWSEGHLGTIGGGAFEHRVVTDARKLLEQPQVQCTEVSVHLVRDLAMCCGGQMTAFLQKVESAPRLRIYGAGHVGTELARVADIAGFAVTVVDGRSEWADPTRFPTTVEVIDAEPEDDISEQGKYEYVVVVTHSHPLDEALIRKMLEQGPQYLGLIGSKGKWARFAQRLSARGLSEERLSEVHCPVGFDLGALTPGEIAVSVVAEMITARRQALNSQ